MVSIIFGGRVFKVLFWVFGAGDRCDYRDSKDEVARRIVGQSNGHGSGYFQK